MSVNLDEKDPKEISSPVSFRRRCNDAPRSARVFVSLTLAVCSALLAKAMHIPLPWLLGPMTVAAALSLSGLDLGISDWFRRCGQTMAGFSVGLYFTPDVARKVLDLGGFMVGTSLISILASLVISIFLCRAAGCDKRTAYFATLPGGLAEMAGLAGQFGANVTLVSLSQTLRVVLIVLTVPPVLAFLFNDGQHVRPAYHLQLALPLAIASIVVGMVLSLGLQRMRVFNAWLLGGLAVGMALGLTGAEHAYAPPVIPSLAQIAIGASLGARFNRSIIAKAGHRFIPATAIATLLLIAVNAAMALLMIGYLDFGTAVLATAPGGIAEMSLTAELLHLAPPIVTAWQLVRILLVALTAGPLFSLYKRYL